MLAGFVPPYDATVVERLLASGGGGCAGGVSGAGAVMVGKTNMDEFAMGSGNVFSAAGPARNPWSADHVPGGSSGGSAAAVAARSCFAALGSDTGGSVREPAAYCGVVGLKPTYGRVSRHGLIAFASSLDTPGVLARSVEDSALVLDAIAGTDARDSTSQPGCHAQRWPGGGGEGRHAGFGFGFTAAARAGGAAEGGALPLEGLVVGVPEEYFVAEMPPDIVDLWTRGVQWLAAAGATTVSVSLPHTRHALPAYCLLSSAEASSNLSRYDGIRYGASAAFREEEGKAAAATAVGEKKEEEEGLSALEATRSVGFGAEVQRRILTGCFVASAGAAADYYEKALLVRRSVAADFNAAFAGGVDVLLTPTTPSAPFEIAAVGEVDPVTMFLNDVMTVPASLAGLPAISVPAALTVAEEGGAPPLPLGLQLVGGAMQEHTLLRAAAALEARAGFQLLDDVSLPGVV